MVEKVIFDGDELCLHAGTLQVFNRGIGYWFCEKCYKQKFDNHVTPTSRSLYPECYPRIICEKCKTENLINQIYCEKCNTELNYKRKKARKRGKIKTKSKGVK